MGSISEVVNIGGSLIQKINKSNVTLLTSFITDPNLLGSKILITTGWPACQKKKNGLARFFIFLNKLAKNIIVLRVLSIVFR